MHCGYLKGKEAPEEGHIHIYMANSLRYAAETNTAL